MSGSFLAVVRRDMALAWSQGGSAALGLAFFLMAVTLTAFAVGPAPQTLARIAPGMLWLFALLASLLSLDRLFQADYEDGSLDDLALSPLPLGFVVMAKVLAHWLATLVPLVLVTPFLGILMNLPDKAYGMLVITLFVGTPALSLIGAIGAALTVAVRRGGALMALLVLPLYVPVLIFATGAVEAAAGFADPLPHLAMLGAVTLVSLAVAPLAAAAAIRLSLE
ncbi:heme exporter protein CcmB [Pseudokordiimonas caeni]|uniref:heme exporter protein CcmB n=1 Tax=Pseudokordiimonas caeni TaxID=2997908 RepID=UPI0028124ABD|nr:heme exporter protein CcmB [Pseudokordiimonas caeni]